MIISYFKFKIIYKIICKLYIIVYKVELYIYIHIVHTHTYTCTLADVPDLMFQLISFQLYNGMNVVCTQ